jgi:exosome complex component MTR3
MSDRRRLLGPVNTIVPNVGTFVGSNDMELDKSDSRRDDEIRKFFLKTGTIENANGSAYLEVGNTVIQTSIFGPRPIHGSFVNRASVSVECKFLPNISQPCDEIFNSQENGTNPSIGRTELTSIEQKISSYIETSLLPSIILEKYPKSTIDIFITIISVDDASSTNGDLLNLINWIVNCSSVALVDAQIEVRDIVTSGQVRLVDDCVVMDPTCSRGGMNALVSFMNLKNDEIVGIWLDDDHDGITDDKVEKLVGGCNEMSKKIRSNINSYLLNSLK